ncbi:hypothetical protein AMS68_003223 [Peltaster fructicola]|uniref:UBC core domain-containing protein n=1 Tax=Peltaster fructicola TaxID=286661 RepID=A0A6H0XSQ0_9PEZI|nr:hypothetical protein AMS68_003223 [Peltaster fructicola]
MTLGYRPRVEIRLLKYRDYRRPRDTLGIATQTDVIVALAAHDGIYVAPVPDEDLLWRGVIFVRKGPYTNAVLRFQIAFTDDYPARPPVITFLTDIFHPLIAPLTTYTYTTRDRASENISAGDEGKLPPGGLTLRHGFAEWCSIEAHTPEETIARDVISHTAPAVGGRPAARPHIIEVLQYMRVVLDTEAVIDSVPLEVAANPGAWHAWRSHRARLLEPRQLVSHTLDSRDRSMSPDKKQPGGARRPGEWNWTGVWEDRVRKAVQSSISDATLYGGDGSSQIEFSKLDDAAVAKLAQIAPAHAT